MGQAREHSAHLRFVCRVKSAQLPRFERFNAKCTGWCVLMKNATPHILYFVPHTCFVPHSEREMESFWPKKLSRWRLKFDPGLRVIREYLSQIDSTILQLLGIPGRILIPPVTRLFRSKWLDFLCSSHTANRISPHIAAPDTAERQQSIRRLTRFTGALLRALRATYFRTKRDALPPRGSPAA